MRLNKYLVAIAFAICSCNSNVTEDNVCGETADSTRQTKQKSVSRFWRGYHSRYMKPEQQKELMAEMSIDPKYVTKFQDITLEEALEKAKAEGKRVFINCHTETCGPCRMMEKNVFPQKECGDYFNKNYVCISKDMEKGEGSTINDKYGIEIYPTYLILNPDGTEVCKVIGAVKDAKKFIKRIEDTILLSGTQTKKK